MDWRSNRLPTTGHRPPIYIVHDIFFYTLLHQSKLWSPSPNLGEEPVSVLYFPSCSPRLGELSRSD